MKIDVITQRQVDVAILARAMANKHPKHFADFWFAFAEEMRKTDYKRLDEFAIVMAPDFGGIRKDVFRRLYRLLAYHEERINRQNNSISAP